MYCCFYRITGYIKEENIRFRGKGEKILRWMCDRDG